jgi:hypothetical protein
MCTTGIHFIHSFMTDIQKMPLCSAYPGPLSVLVMDNAHIHHGDGILELADRFGEFTQVIIYYVSYMPM